MSEALRKKLFNELEKKATKKLNTYTKITNAGSVFDEGTTILDRRNYENEVKNWRAKTISNASPALTEEEAFAATQEDLDWKSRSDKIYKKMQKAKSNSFELWIGYYKAQGKPSDWQSPGVFNKGIRFHYRRKAGYKGTNLEGTFNETLKKVVKECIQTPLHIEYSHGKKLPKDFKGKNSDGSDNFHGGAGTLNHRKIENALKNVYKKYTGPKDEMFISVQRLFTMKFEDMFDTELLLDGKRSKRKDSTTLRYRGQLLFKYLKKNPGSPDKEMLDHFKSFIGKGEPEEAMSTLFAQEVMRLCKVDLNKAQQLWSDSPGPLDRANIMKQALAAEGLLTVKGKLDKRSKRVSKGGGLDMRMKVNQEFIKKMKKLKPSRGETQGKVGNKMKKVTSSKGSIGAIPLKKPRVRTRDAAKTAQSPLHLEAMLEALLPQEVAKRMGQGGALNYKTGRFAESVEPTQVMVGPRGGVQVDYTYMKMPYQTFEPGYVQGSTQRDPRKIIGESVRAIAQSIIGDKFLKVRRV